MAGSSVKYFGEADALHRKIRHTDWVLYGIAPTVGFFAPKVVQDR